MKILRLIALFPVLLTMLSLHSAFATLQEKDTSSGIWNVVTNHQIQIAANITNNQNIKQPFAYIVQVLDSEDKAVMISWIQGTLQPRQSMSPSQSWTPTKPGTYTTQIFDWPCLDNCGALSTPLEMKIIVT